ncbi:uncharacterized protein LOC144073247 [Stigmatopora argus]
MAEKLKDLVSEKKALLESAMEVFEHGAQVVAILAGDFFPIVSIAAPIVQMALDNVESKEVVYMKEQFQKVGDRLGAISDQTRRIYEEIKRSGMDVSYFSVEENITNQFRKYIDILDVKPEFREVKKKIFMEHFKATDGDQNLHTLYDAVTGAAGSPMLDVVLEHEEKSRRVLEDFCARLKKLFCLGIIALMGHAALKGDSREEALLKTWRDKMKEVQEKMNAVIQICERDFVPQAKLDAQRLLRDAPDRDHRRLAENLLAHLRKKYDWVSWSVRVFGAPTGCLAPNEFHYVGENNHFRVSAAGDKLNVHVSYGPQTVPVDHAVILRVMATHMKPLLMTNVAKVANDLYRESTHAVAVHVILPAATDLVCVCSFPDEMHHWKLHKKKMHVCLHSA